MTDHWIDSWAMASIWVVIPTVYIAALIGAAGADLTLSRRRHGRDELVIAGRRRWRVVNGVHLAAIWLIVIALPAAVVTAAVGVTAAIAGAEGTWEWGYVLNGVIFATLALAAGRLAGVVISSPVFAPAAAFVLALSLGLYLAPIPPSTYPWEAPSASFTASLTVLAIVLVFAGECLAGARLAVRARHGSWWPRAAAAGFAGIAAFGGVYALTGQPAKVPRSTTTPQCVSTANGTPVCVWPDDHRFLAPLLEQTARFESITAALDWAPDSWEVREPGLTTGGTPEASIVVQPVQLGSGMWLTAQDFAYALAPACPAVADMTVEEIDDVQVLSLSGLDALSNYIYGGQRPAEVIVIDDPGPEREAAAIVQEVTQMSEQDQFGWIVNNVNTWLERCT